MYISNMYPKNYSECHAFEVCRDFTGILLLSWWMACTLVRLVVVLGISLNLPIFWGCIEATMILILLGLNQVSLLTSYFVSQRVENVLIDQLAEIFDAILRFYCAFRLVFIMSPR